MIKRIFPILILLFATPVWANTQVHLSGMSTTAVNVAATTYTALNGTGTGTTQFARACPAADAGNITYMKACVTVDPANGAGVQSVTFTEQVALVDSSTTCTITEGDSDLCCESSTASAYTAGQALLIEVTPANTPAAANFTVVTHTVSSTANKLFLCANESGNADVTNVEYNPWVPGQNGTTENNVQIPFPFDTTFIGLYCQSSAPASAGDTYTMTIMENGAAVADISCAISGGTATTCNDTSSTLTGVAGDVYSMRITPNSTPDAVIVACSYGFTNTVGGFMWSGGTQTNYADAISTFYHSPVGVSTYSATESDKTNKTSAVTLRSAYGALFVAPDNGALEQGYTYTIRDDAASTGCEFFISEAEITDSDTACTDVIAVDSAVGYQLAPTLVPVATGGWVSVSAILTSEAARRVILTQ